ncbi:MAG: hypothetical protein ACD_72C00289G0003 [uncultured bacterium]|nr:MAG: hypothetical protein ACD_72C00289G0003 [uncultured bacterium]
MKTIHAIIHYLFLSAITVKAFNGTVEVLGGLLFLFFGREVENEIYLLVNYEFAGPGNGIIAKSVVALTNGLVISTDHFVAFYLLFHGLMNFALVAAIYRKKMWAYPAAVILFSLVLIYQFVRLSMDYSTGLAVVSFIDLLMIALTWLEYKRIISEK